MPIFVVNNVSGDQPWSLQGSTILEEVMAVIAAGLSGTWKVSMHRE